VENIIEMRKRIDELDGEILRSLAERVELCRSIGSIKKAHNSSIRDIQREKEVYENAKQKAVELGLDVGQVEGLYRQIVNMCSSVQE
jgi:chorismate mutase